MFNIRKLFILCAAMLAILTSCEFGSLEKRQETGSAVFDFSSVNSRLKSESRTALSEFVYEEVDTFADLKLEGDFEYFQKINLKETQTLKIDNIPVGSKITASIEIYMEFVMEDEGRTFKEAMWHGTSDQYEIKDGPNEIIIPLINGGFEEIIDEPEEAENKITIYVKHDDEHEKMNIWETDEATTNDGTEEHPFNYIQSAFNWISNNGTADTNYEILLTGYEDNAFNQFIEITGSIKNHAKSITLTSSKPEIIAVECSFSPFMELKDTDSYNIVPIKFTNIQISTTFSNSSAQMASIISATNDGYGFANTYCDITLGQGTVFLGNNNTTTSAGGAIHLRCGSIMMEGNATIKDFKATGKGGAVFIDNGSFTMKGSSKIENCEVTHANELSNGEGGGAFCIANPHSTVTLKENASIIGCKATYGGAVFVHQGQFHIDSGSITGCSASTNGGAIYLNIKADDTTALLYGGTISSNTADGDGAAVYVPARSSDNIAQVIMGGDIFVDSDNDIYNADGSPILLRSKLTTENTIAATITYNSLKITSGNIVLKKYDYSEEDDPVSNSYSKIKVRTLDDSTSDYTYWTVDQEGKLTD